jgi:hypothetical protein
MQFRSVDALPRPQTAPPGLADLQHRGLKKIGFVNNDSF